MAQKLDGGLPQNMDLGGGYTLRFTAVDPATGAAATGVNVSSAFILADNILAVPPETLEFGPFVVTPVAPLWAPLPTGIDEDAA